MINNEEYSIILPGRIIEFFPENQTATIQISAERITHTSERTNSLTERLPLEEVPVHTPSGGGWSITMPIKPGNTCLLFFSQVGYEHWLYEDKDKAGTLAGLPKPWLNRQFNEDDGFALVGMNTLPRAIQDYDANHSQWRGPDSSKQVISLNDDETITITSSTKLTINAPSVVVNCDTAVVEAVDSVSINTPITAISKDVTIGGTLEVTGAVTNLDTVSNTGIVTNVAAVNTSGITTTAGIAVSGGAAANMGSSAITGTGSLVIDGVNLKTHVHAGDGGLESGVDTGPPL